MTVEAGANVGPKPRYPWEYDEEVFEAFFRSYSPEELRRLGAVIDES